MMKITCNRLTSAAAAAAFKPVRRIIALGDIHGDLKKANEILKASGVARSESGPGSKHLTWQQSSPEHHSGLPTKLVQCGDLVHRGPDDVDVMELFIKLRNESHNSSKTEETKVVCLLGNHEEMMGWGSVRYAEGSAKQYFMASEIGRQCARPTMGVFQQLMQELMAPGSRYGDFIRSLPLAHLDAKTVFNHAGLDPTWVGGDAQSLSQRVASMVGGGSSKSSGDLSPAQRVAALNAEAEREWTMDPRSKRGTERVLADPVWNRSIYAGAKNGRNTSRLDQTLKLLDAKRMVVGHTPHQDVVTAYAGGKLVAVDIAMSCGMANNTPEALEILVDANGDSIATHAITIDGKRREVMQLVDSRYRE